MVEMKGPVTVAVLGAGLRGSDAYASYALQYPNEMRVVAVAEPDGERRRLFCEAHHLSEAQQFIGYEELLQQEKLSDCVLVCTQDKMHYMPVMKALEKGYHVLCEKPMSPAVEEIVKMGAMAKECGRIFAICHVLRYSPFFVKIKELLEARRIGQLISMQQTEHVGYWHHAHSFVRGNWRRAEETSPMILAKCCHDMDILLWLAESSCSKISSFGDLTYFKAENAPQDAPQYCMDGCRHRDTCPYYAPRFYLEHPKAVQDNLIRAVSADIEPARVLEKLKKGPYGRCVFRCDNTVVDHQVVSIKFQNDVDASLVMCAFTKDCKREITLMGSMGQITGDMDEGKITIYDFVSGNTEEIQLNAPAGGHQGSDAAMMKAFISQVAADGDAERRTDAAISVESHLMCLAAERSRAAGEMVDFTLYKEESGYRE